MKPIVALIALGLSAGVVSAHASQALASKSRCMTCHDVAKKKLGPAFKDIAAKYRGQPNADVALAESALKGSKGKWGKVPMPPQKIKPEDAQTLSRWILSL